MKVVVFVGKNHEDSSLYFVARTIQERVEGSVIVKAFSDKQLAHADLVINLDTECMSDLVKNSRYYHYKKVVNLLAGNLTENQLPEQLRILGHVHKTPLVVHSEHSLREVQEFCRKWFLPSVAKQMLRNVHLVLYGIEDQFVPSGRNDPRNFIVPYNRLNQIQKNVNQHHEVTEKVKLALKMQGVEADMMFIASPHIKSAQSSTENYPAYRFVEQPATRDEYRALIQDRGMFICTSLYESFGIYYLELLCTGVVGVFLDRPWVRTLLPGYPLVCEAQYLAELTLEVYAAYPRWAQFIREDLVPYIRQRYNLDKFVKGLLEVGGA